MESGQKIDLFFRGMKVVGGITVGVLALIAYRNSDIALQQMEKRIVGAVEAAVARVGVGGGVAGRAASTTGVDGQVVTETVAGVASSTSTSVPAGAVVKAASSTTGLGGAAGAVTTASGGVVNKRAILLLAAGAVGCTFLYYTWKRVKRRRDSGDFVSADDVAKFLELWADLPNEVHVDRSTGFITVSPDKAHTVADLLALLKENNILMNIAKRRLRDILERNARRNPAARRREQAEKRSIVKST